MRTAPEHPAGAAVAALRGSVSILGIIAGSAIVGMMAVTCADIVLRQLGHPIVGAYDIVRIAGTLAIGCALPYTTAVKGHVAVEFLVPKLRPLGRLLVEALVRSFAAVFFGALAWQCYVKGEDLRTSGEVTATLELPIFWVSYLIGIACAVAVLVEIYHLRNPGKSLMKP